MSFSDGLGAEADAPSIYASLRDMKLSPVIEDWDTGMLRQYGRMCAHALARAHARSGDAAMLAGHMVQDKRLSR